MNVEMDKQEAWLALSDSAPFPKWLQYFAGYGHHLYSDLSTREQVTEQTLWGETPMQAIWNWLCEWEAPEPTSHYIRFVRIQVYCRSNPSQPFSFAN